ncbi:MAG: amidohydrolase family protein [Myxococcaceae bacterium]|nr:amidohydrolase family protein [Myxococcaceae bacterium]
MPLPALDDEEGPRLPASLPPVVDAHVHLFPDKLFEAIWRWFDRYGGPIRYKLTAEAVVKHQLDRGVAKLVALLYSHKPGMARELNTFMAGLAANEPRIIGLGTVYPGEPGAADIVREAFAMGLHGIKLHCHVQAFAPDDPKLHEVYAACADAGRPLIMHSGREPKSPAYPVDVYSICAAERVDRVLKAHPKLKLCVPHFGADEFEAYADLLERHDNLWLDTTMMGAAFFPLAVPRRLFDVRPERIIYGTDFPNLPYAWDREVKQLLGLKLREDRLAALLGQNALALYCPSTVDSSGYFAPL